MELHEFMLPEALPKLTSLQDLAADNLPSPLFVGFDRSRMQVLTHEGLREFSDEAEVNEHLSAGYKGIRRVAILAPQFEKAVGPVLLDLEDSRYTPRELHFGRDLNVLQYNRRKGDRTAALWRLRSYFEPSASLGHPPRGGVQDPIDFTDKKPMVYWRGGTSGSVWSSPWKRSSPPMLTPQTSKELSKFSRFSRFGVVLDATNRDFVDARFSGSSTQRVDPSVGDSEVIDDHVHPSTMLENRYLLCPRGNDVASSLYWILKTNSVAFREEVAYEVIPDFFIKPWVHYVPLEPGLGDLREKFEFCERNHELMRRILDNASQAYDEMTNKEVWSDAEAIVLERLGIAS